MKSLKKLEMALNCYVRPLTYPVVVKLLRTEADIPKGISTARQFYGHRIAGPCHGWAMARHNGESVAMLRGDMTCPIPSIALGLVQSPEYFVSGDFYLMTGWYANTREKGAKLASQVPRFTVGEYVGLAMAPIHACDFEPDMIMVFCNPTQLRRLVAAVFHVECQCFDTSICLDLCTIIVRVQQTARYQLGIPCWGSRTYDAPSADEVVFAAPTAKLEELAEGLKYTEEHGITIPTKRWLDYEPDNDFWRRLRDSWERPAPRHT